MVAAASVYVIAHARLGSVPALAAVVGVWLMLLAYAPLPERVRGLGVRLSVFVAVAYASAIGVDTCLATGPRADSFVVAQSRRGMFMADPVLGHRMVPGWQGTYDDSVVQVPVQLNGWGHRDDEPRGESIDDDVLLVGDSFTFGQGLPREHTTQARIEARTELRAYSTGVPGWGAPQARHVVDTLPWRGSTVVYLYCANDAEWTNVEPTANDVWDGWAVTRKPAPGVVLSDAEVEQRVQALLRSREPWPRATATLRDRLTLKAVRGVVLAFRDPNLRLLGSPSSAYRAEFRPRVVEQVEAMRRRAAELDAAFHVVVLPAMMEAEAGRWAPATEAMIAAMRGAGIEPDLGLLERLEYDDYLTHDGHFGPGGADITAGYVIELMGE